LYFQSPGHWTNRPDEAFDFGSMSRAIMFAKGAGFSRMDLARVSEQLQAKTAVPLEAVCCSPRPDGPGPIGLHAMARAA